VLVLPIASICLPSAHLLPSIFFPPAYLQDHIVAGTLMTMRDTFLTQKEYSKLIYECVAQDCR
jgi:hypothetical protein